MNPFLRDVISVMFVRMKPLVKWPDRAALQKTMPMQFRRHFGKKCVVIIDCFEVFTDRYISYVMVFILYKLIPTGLQIY